MSILRYVTLTGAGEKIAFMYMKNQSKDFPLAEWGILYSESLAGKENRYPPLEWIERFAKKANKANMNIALHLCGSIVKKLLAQAKVREFTPETQRILDLIERFGRVQLNTVAKKQDLEAFRMLIQRIVSSENRTRVILQWNTKNAEMCRLLSFEHGFEALVDASGGRGVARKDWPDLHEASLPHMGYAGGLDPETLEIQLPRIAAAAAHRPFWIDAEGQLRDDRDLLDLVKCYYFLRKAHAFWIQEREALGAQYGTGMYAVNKLSGLWLNWWVAASQYRSVATVIPPSDASAVRVLNRHTGSFDAPYLGGTVNLLGQEKIGLIPQKNGTWSAYALDTPQTLLPGATLEEAGFRAIVAKYFGEKVPKNPTALSALRLCR